MTFDLQIYPSSILKQRMPEIIDFDGLAPLTNKMFEFMEDNKLVGLACNQINIKKRMFVMNCGIRRVIINPVILGESAETKKDSEGCASFPSFLVDVERPVSVVMKYQDINGIERLWQFRDLEARCAKHENDHLNGITFLKYLPAQHRAIIERKFR